MGRHRRRGIFVYPTTWGEGPAGTVGGEDIYQIPEVINGSPHILRPLAACGVALPPRSASSRAKQRQSRRSNEPGPRQRPAAFAGWDPARGRLVFDTPYTQGIAGWIGAEPVSFASLDFATDNSFAVLVATSISDEPIATTKRLLVSAIARVEPTGFRWVDSWKREVADPGRPPFFQEPVTARVVWRQKGAVKAYVLDNTGKRIEPVKLERLPQAATALSCRSTARQPPSTGN